MFQERCYDRDVDISNNYFADNMTNNIDMDYNMTQGMDNLNMNYQNDTCPNNPIVEPMQERCINRTIMHVIPHVCPFLYDICKL